MAFIDKDELGKPLVNIHNRVGAQGNWEDVVVVQELLQLVYANHPLLIKLKLHKQMNVTGRPNMKMVMAIINFQILIMKRSKPEGYINRYSGSHMYTSTIWKLNDLAQKSLAYSKKFESVAEYLKATHPMLSGSLNDKRHNSNQPERWSREQVNQYDLSR